MATSGEHTELTKGIADEIKRKIDEHKNGDTERLILIMLLAIHEIAQANHRNPAMRLGRFYEQYPKLAGAVFVAANFMMWVLAVSTIAVYAKTIGIMP